MVFSLCYELKEWLNNHNNIAFEDSGDSEDDDKVPGNALGGLRDHVERPTKDKAPKKNVTFKADRGESLMSLDALLRCAQIRSVSFCRSIVIIQLALLRMNLCSSFVLLFFIQC